MVRVILMSEWVSHSTVLIPTSCRLIGSAPLRVFDIQDDANGESLPLLEMPNVKT